MKVGDLVIDEWGDMAIVLSQTTPFSLRWRIKYISHGGRLFVALCDKDCVE